MMILWQANARDSVASNIISQLRLHKSSFDYNFPSHVNNSSGLYCFWLRTSCLYVGMSEDLQRRISQHIHAEDNPQLATYFRSYPNEIKISFVYLNVSASELRRIELELIQEFNPETNRQGI